MKRRTNKRQGQERRYTALRAEFLAANPHCAVCFRGATEVHHMRGRRGLDLCRVEHFLAVCRGCHQRITEQPAWAFANGFSLRRVGAA